MKPGIELRHLRSFVAVAEELHFGRAAARLGIAQPPLSQQIQRLEAGLGTRLFDRTNRRVALTDAGRALLEHAGRVLQGSAAAVEAVRRAARGESGPLRVAFAASVMFLSLPRIIRAFRQRYPEVRLDLREMPTGLQLEALRAEELDIGFLRQPDPDPELELETVMSEPLRAAVPVGHPLATRSRIRLESLAAEPFVLFPREIAPGLHAQVLALCRSAGFAPRVVQESRELYTTVSLVEAGMGVTIIPASVAKMGWTSVRYLPIASLLARTRIAAAWRTDRDRPVIHSFLEVARARAGG
ncbi:MAG TPA: LysR family transcriptional regulator [Gemmatimonadales bacterium]|nr:LysR family transcriptional regulator [Gemmatimonadales bacterium]